MIASCLARIRQRQAYTLLAESIRSNGFTELGKLPQALEILISPHHLRYISINDRKWQAPPADARSGQLSKPKTWTANIAGLDTAVEYQLCQRTNLFDDRVEPLSVLGRIEDIIFHYALLQGHDTRPTAPTGAAGGARESAKQILERHRGTEITTRDYFVCFVALAVHEKAKGPNFQVAGSLIQTLQERLGEDYAIYRRTTNAPSANGNGNNREPLAISQLVTGADSLRYAEREIGGIRLDKGRGSLQVMLL